jgi:hypothetical protein
MPSRKRFIQMQSRDLSAILWRTARPAAGITHISLLCDFVKTCSLPLLHIEQPQKYDLHFTDTNLSK